MNGDVYGDDTCSPIRAHQQRSASVRHPILRNYSSPRRPCSGTTPYRRLPCARRVVRCNPRQSAAALTSEPSRPSADGLFTTCRRPGNSDARHCGPGSTPCGCSDGTRASTVVDSPPAFTREGVCSEIAARSPAGLIDGRPIRTRGAPTRRPRNPASPKAFPFPGGPHYEIPTSRGSRLRTPARSDGPGPVPPAAKARGPPPRRRRIGARLDPDTPIRSLKTPRSPFRKSRAAPPG